MDQVIAIKESLGAELWLMVLAFGAGALSRLVKPFTPKPLLPYLSVGAGIALAVGWALAAKEPIPAAITLGALAGGMAIGGHELAKKFLERFVGTALAEKLLGVASADQPKPSKVTPAALVLLVALAGCSGADRVRALNAADVAADQAKVELDGRYRAEHEACMRLETAKVAACYAGVREKHAPARAAYRAFAEAWNAAAKLHLATEAGADFDLGKWMTALAALAKAEEAVRTAVKAVSQ